MNFLRTDLRRAFEDKRGVDVTFLVGYNEENVEKLEANKYILSLRSSVFETQFSELWIKKQKEKGQAGTDNNNKERTGDNANDGLVVIKIPDANPSAFHSFLKYLYTDELDVTKLEDVVGVYYLGLKYHVPHLVDAALELLKESLEVYNVLPVLEEASMDLYKHLDQIQAAVYQVFSKYSEELINSEEFTELSQNALISIVKLNVLGVDEAVLFTRVYKWALAECERHSIQCTNQNVRTLLGPDILYNIRFLSLSSETKQVCLHPSGLKLTEDLLSKIWGTNGILINKEQLALLRRQTLGRVSQVVNYNTNPRRLRITRAIERVSGGNPAEEWPSVEMNREKNTCCFFVNRRAELVGFGFFGSLSTINAKYNIIVEVRRKPSSSTTVGFAEVTTKRVCREPGKMMTVFLNEPLAILKETQYSISYSIKGPPTFTGDGNLKTRVMIKDFLKNKRDFIVHFQNADDENNSNKQLPILYFRAPN